MTREEAIKQLKSIKSDYDEDIKRFPELVMNDVKALDMAIEALSCEMGEWEHIWDAPDGTYKARCTQCGLTKFFIEGHDAQYEFCPSCGSKMSRAIEALSAQPEITEEDVREWCNKRCFTIVDNALYFEMIRRWSTSIPPVKDMLYLQKEQAYMQGWEDAHKCIDRREGEADD